MGDVDDRIYDVVNPLVPPAWSPAPQHASKLKRSKTIAHTSHRYNGYAVPRSCNPPTPPPPRPIPNPPVVPPRNRNSSEGTDMIMALSCSPSDRGRIRTMSKSPSVLSVGSTHSVVEELALSEFMSKYSKSLPLRVKVCKGFYGISDQTAVTTGETINFHFMKTTKVVIAEATIAMGTKLSFPIHSSIKFGLLYDPNDNLEEAKRGFHFNTVAEILAMKSLPKVVRVRKTYNGSNAESSVTVNELLVVKSTKSKLTGKQLKVFSVTGNRKKTLGENCCGKFSTAPADICMYLYELTMNMQEGFPCKALPFLPEDAGNTVLADLSSSVVTLKQATTESSVIATAAVTEDGEQSDVAEMPVDLDIEVEAVALDEIEIEQLRHDTRYMYELFDPFSVCLYMNKPTNRLYDMQCLLYKTIIMYGDLRGLEILRPSTISLPQRTSTSCSTNSGSGSGTVIVNKPYQPLNPEGRDKPCTDYYVLMTPLDRSISQEQASQESDFSGDSQVSDHLAYLEHHNKNIEKKVVEACDEIARMSQKLNQIGNTTEHLRKWCDSLQNQIRMLQAEKMGIDDRPPAPLPDALTDDGLYSVLRDHGKPTPSPSPKDTNNMTNGEFLASLDHSQVLRLLEVMGLKQYQEKFKAEQVNGEILSECDESVLQSDLGVSSKLHRMRLLKVINGRHSAKDILKGEDPYAHRKRQPAST